MPGVTNTKNFAKATVSAGYAAGVTSIDLTAGHGAKMPTAPFRFVWWNSTDYSDPSDDPNVEEVLCTAISTDTLTIEASANAHNTGGKTYKIIAGVSSQMVTDLQAPHLHMPLGIGRAVPYFQIEEMDSGWSDWYAKGTVAHDSSVYRSGSASIKLILSNDNSNCGMRKNITDGDWRRKAMRFWVRSTDWANVQTCSLLLSTSGTFTAFFELDLKNYLVSPPNDEWIEIVCTKSDFSVGAGTPDWSTVNDVIVRAKAVNLQTPTVWFDSLAVYNAPNNGMVSVVFDDAEDSQYTQGKLKLDQYNFPGTAYVIWNAIGDANKLTQAQVDALAAAGWDISGHGDTNLTTLTAAQIEEDLRSMRQYLVAYGYKGMDNYALPNGDYSDAVLAKVYKYFLTARNIDGLKQSAHYASRRINAVSISQATSTATIQGYVDKAIKNGDWLILVFHKIVTTPTVDTEYSIANFGTVVDYLSTSGIDVVTVSEALLRGYQEPPMRTKTSYAAGTAYQLTTSAAQLNFGTTDPGVTLDRPGKYLLSARVRIDYNGATFAANRTVTLKLRRTNNTAADVTGATSSFKTQIVTTLSHSAMVVQLPMVLYETENVDDIIQIYGSIDTGPTAGSIDAVEAEIVAIRIS